ncbi:DuF1740 family protein [Sugiyamaella lignohabitans]|uniref:DuF1740 family protein n=1 Tax=Sugiyamaella lignohabitans TaxID=796027 RepID=A0A167EH48_9ASCO|nr:DuF1740 family protein [Sugiyamaella lignohabitans]ANB14076.1 DuF1740 family protein [Sugiyamaella lignohabitans]
MDDPSGSFPKFTSFGGSKEKDRKGSRERSKRSGSSSSHGKTSSEIRFDRRHSKIAESGHVSKKRDRGQEEEIKYFKGESVLKGSGSRHIPKLDKEVQAFLDNVTSDLRNGGKARIQLSDPIPPTPGLFEYDLMGDKYNAQFMKPHKPSIPKYFRSTSRVIGLPGNMRIMFSKDDLRNGDVVLIEKSRDQIGPVLWHDNRSFITKRPVKFLGYDDHANDEIENLLEIGNKEADVEVFSDQYLQTLLKGRALIYDTLNRAPNDTDLWLKVLEYEENILRYSRAAKSNVNDIIDTVLQRALRHNPGNRLLIQRFIRNQKMQTRSFEKWRELVVEFPNVVDYWLCWVDSTFQQSANISVLDVIKRIRIQGVFDLLEAKYHAQVISREEMEHIFAVLIHKIGKFLVEAGYFELAIGIYQGLIELNYFSPLDESLGLEITLKSFQQYWNMETPHIGESEAVGWQNTEQVSKVRTGSSYPLPARSIDLPGTKEEYNQFLAYRIVLFRDIEPFLKIVRTKSGRSDLLWGLVDILEAPLVEWKYSTTSLIPQSAGGDEKREIIVLFCARVISQLIKGLTSNERINFVSNEFWAWAMQFLAEWNQKHFDRLSRILISQNQQNMDIWTNYANVLFKSNATLARSIFEGALKDMTSASMISRINCWNHWALGELNVDGDFRRLLIALKLQDQNRESLQQFLDRAPFSLEVGVSRVFLDYIFSDKLHQGVALRNVLQRFWESVERSKLAVDSFTNRALLACLDHYKRNNPLASTEIVQDFLASTILSRTEESWPDTAIFSKLAEVENAFGRNSKLSVAISDNNNIATQISWLVYSLKISKLNIYSIRAVYERVLGSDSEARVCSRIWHMYYDFEVNVGEDDSYDRAASILLRGIEYCGWSSELYYLCLQEPVVNRVSPVTLENIKKTINQRLLRLGSRDLAISS